ncbi:hypothetical protein D9757_008949 [Collybiopsis confluens]|uniref:Uncharacterized protein n=1 Tax=Collybiopsis confluens TaxID=2823264 RepID=A0A8H5HFL4_9AGAR|nr:hypothetical protein D9757_008949 [Collybiopsis confluens]
MLSQPTSNRSRNQNRKRANEDASYIGSTAGVKRQAQDRVDEAAARAKRKKIEAGLPEVEHRISMVDFIRMPASSIHQYLQTFDLIPSIRPLPSSADEPQPPYTLGPAAHQQTRLASPPPPPQPTASTNRPRRDPREMFTRHSTRHDDFPYRTPILADLYELQAVLASLAEKHFREMAPISGREEVDALAAFLCAIENNRKGSRTR